MILDLNSRRHNNIPPPPKTTDRRLEQFSICESPLSGCVHKKRVKMKNKWHFTTSCVWDILLNFVLCHILCIFSNFIKVTWKLGYLRRLNFFYFISSCKIIDLFQDVVTNASPQKCKLLGRGAPQDHKNKVSRPSAICTTNRTHLKSKNHKFLRLQIMTVC